MINDLFKFIFKNQFILEWSYDNMSFVNEIKNKVNETIKQYPDLKGIGISIAGDFNNKDIIILWANTNHKNYLGTKFK